ncbi:MAG: Hsp20/alpha crystallin family protein [Desulfobulbaceae bacterium]|nr:Hsp20/alpha crystallin family protein [Desulfobulbaceae bacterium]
MSKQELKVQEKQSARAQGEHTKNEIYYAPQVDIYETEQEVVVVADVPGVLPEGVDVSLEDNVLTIQGRRDVEQHGGRMVLEEYEPGHYLRRFTVAETIDQERIEASLADGVLRVRLPKAAPAQPKKIAVKIG